MRLSGLSFLLYSLSLVAVAMGQSRAVSDALSDLTDSTSSATSVSTTDSQSSTTTSTITSTTSTAEPTTTTTTAASTTSSSTSSSSSSSEEESTTSTTTTTVPSTTSESSTTTTSSHSTASEPTSTSSTSTKSTATAFVTTITSTEIISGTPVPTTFTSTHTDASATESPGLSGADGSSDSGLSDSQKRIIIGVVVGVGGAILLGAIGVVAWRLQARKRNARDNDDVADLMSGTAVGSGAREKAPNPSGGTPFRTTLDQYHNPGPVNAASNF
ncbi:hypothetical protein P175DRAFT_0492365 [Aspergillus ochraceoroseus IBT 24754]|uniref:Mid2 domain-containing protein n=2 Tax=Aspergillus ochraceoroseus TaxID=138278 RepID=A0A2T5LZM7_9EURO|nr:uncharacterized protein P175DRAFT_0492365 [Aspergillus ochraceoroseus IBT 24754]KKK15336.1 hypothetical protein AOCH_006049 [Aspergillus ochraceoroseus]PTU21738.1 hypothetical protein P175DRAFT_0492365 [Aspergillus ochraceoroseus IBT 24754]